MECSNCGVALRPTAKICIKCGTPVAQAPAAPQALELPSPVPVPQPQAPIRESANVTAGPTFEAAPADLYMNVPAQRSASTAAPSAASARPAAVKSGAATKWTLTATAVVAAIAVFYFSIVRVLATKSAEVPHAEAVAPAEPVPTPPAVAATVSAATPALTTEVPPSAAVAPQATAVPAPATAVEAAGTQTVPLAGSLSREVLTKESTSCSRDIAALQSLLRSNQPARAQQKAGELSGLCAKSQGGRDMLRTVSNSQPAAAASTLTTGLIGAGPVPKPIVPLATVVPAVVQPRPTP